MEVFFKEISLADGAEVLIAEKKDRLVGGRKCLLPSGHLLFTKLLSTGQPMRCWKCGLEATSFILERGQNDHVRPPTLNLYAWREHVPVLMTRDHIIPKAWGGVDAVENLRIACGPCNHKRQHALDEEDLRFMQEHPELIVRGPDWSPPAEIEELSEEEKLRRKKLRNARRNKRLREKRKPRRRNDA